MMQTAEKQFFTWRYDCQSGIAKKSNIAIYQKKILGLQRDLNPMMAFVLVLQCFTDWAKKTHASTLGAGRFAEFILNHEWNETWNEDDVNCRNTNLYENNYDHSMFHLQGKDEP